MRKRTLAKLLEASSMSGAQARVLVVDIGDGLEDKMEPDDMQVACAAPTLVDLRRETLDTVSQLFQTLGSVIDKSARDGQERFMTFMATGLARSLLRFLDFGYLMVSELFGCDWVHLRESYQQLYEDLERHIVAFCDLVDSSIFLSESTNHIRHEAPVMPSKRDTIIAARQALKDIKHLQIVQQIESYYKSWQVDQKATGQQSGQIASANKDLCNSLAIVVQDLLDIFPDMASEMRHMPGGVPAWTQRSMMNFLRSTGAHAADLQDQLFLRPVPWGGWPATRASALCDGVQPPDLTGGSRLSEPKIREARRDASGYSSWQGATPRQILEAIEASGRPMYHSYVSIRNAVRFNNEVTCQQAVGLLYDPALCLESELGLGGVIYYVNNDPEVDDQLYVRWIGTAWSGKRSEEKPVWKAFLDPILAPPQPYDMISLSPVAGNCQVLWEILEADSISLASLVYVPINPVVPPPLEVKPDYTHFFVWNRRKTKAARRAGIDSDLIQFQTLRRYIAAQCSLQSVVQLLGPLGYELLYLEHIYAVFVHEHVAPLLRQQLGETGPKPSTFEVWRQGWHCSPYSRYMLHLEASFGVDATWLSPDGQGAGEKGLGCLRSFREFLASEGHLISANYTGKGSCAEELETSPESSRQALERRLKAIRASAGASKGLASAQVLAGSSDSNQSMWCWYHLSSNCACLPPYRGSHCDILDQSSDDQVRPFRAAMVYVLLDATQQATQALTERLRKLWLFNGQPGRGYAVLIFHSGLSQETLEQLALASENKIWLLKIPEAVGSVTRPGALRMRWFQSGQVFGHPALRSLDVFWDISADPTEFSAEMQDPLLALHRAALAPAACRRGSARVRLGAELEELTEIYLLHHGKEWKDFLEAGGVKILTGADKADAACTVWRRSFLASDVFTRYIRYLEDTGAFLGAFPDSTAAAVTAVGAAVTAFLDSRSRALLLG
ncbi:unnamed protein product [Effrenium voratum]|uniref:Uncharacterized protein n=1 Tax=Effrenium voratum TaxID=2562239 RepID=A0AA36MUR1_9DINO|nr:unnamed protein product [Effrenium voratum]